MRRIVDAEPLRRRHLVRADDPAHLVVQHLRGRSRQRAETQIAEPCEVLGEREVERCRALPDLERRERVHVDPGHGVLDRPDDVRVVVAREGRMDPALEADLGRAALPRLLGAPHDLLERDEIRGAAQVRRQLALREGAEAAAEVADVRVLDVPGHDVADLVAADLAAQAVGSSADACGLSPAGFEETRDLVLAEVGPGELERKRVGAHDERDVTRFARCPCVVAREAARIGRSSYVRGDLGIDPTLEIGDVLGVERKARSKLDPAACRRLAQSLDLGPRRLGIHMVDGHGRHAAPVVDPGIEQAREVVEREVRRRLHVPGRAEQDASDSDRPEMVVERGLGMRRHPRAGLRPEVLDDDLLDVSVLLAERPQREQRVDPLLARLPDPDEDSARERNRELTREPDRLQPASWDLVGRGPVRSALLSEPLGRRLEHDPHRGRDRPQRLELVARHDAGIEVREETRLLEHEPRAALEVLERRPAAERDAALRARPCSAARACRRA